MENGKQDSQQQFCMKSREREREIERERERERETGARKREREREIGFRGQGSLLSVFCREKIGMRFRGRRRRTDGMLVEQFV
jgi:hypothetical protein